MLEVLGLEVLEVLGTVVSDDSDDSGGRADSGGWVDWEDPGDSVVQATSNDASRTHATGMRAAGVRRRARRALRARRARREGEVMHRVSLCDVALHIHR